jgi:hypothetical protein
MANQQGRQGKGGGGGDPGPAKDKDVAVSINSLHRTYQAASEKADQYNTRQFIWTRRAAIAAIVYTVVTAALLATGVWSAIQATNAVNQASQALAEAQRSADAATQAVGEAKRAADAAQEQVATARDTEHRQLRAYWIESDTWNP